MGLPSTRRLLDSGALVVTAVIAKVGRQDYPDLGRDRFPETGFIAYIPASELKASAQGLQAAPVTDSHPAGDVTVENWTALAKGTTSDPRFSKKLGQLKAELLIREEGLIRKVTDNVKSEVSPGYTASFIDVAKDPEGAAAVALGCNVVQRNRTYNHTAIVYEARGGHQVKIEDSMDDKNKGKDESGITKAQFEALQTELKKVQDSLVEKKAEVPESKEKVRDAIKDYTDAKSVADALDLETVYTDNLKSYQRSIIDSIAGKDTIEDSELALAIELTSKLVPKFAEKAVGSLFKKPSNKKVNDGAPIIAMPSIPVTFTNK